MAKTIKNLLQNQMISKLGIVRQGQKLYKVYINDDPGMTLLYFMARSTWVAHILKRVKLKKFFNVENL